MCTCVEETICLDAHIFMCLRSLPISLNKKHWNILDRDIRTVLPFPPFPPIHNLGPIDS